MRFLIICLFLFSFANSANANHKKLPTSFVIKEDIKNYINFFKTMALECRKKIDRYGHPKQNYTALTDWVNCVWKKDQEYYLDKEHQLLIIPNFTQIAERRANQLFSLAKETSIEIISSEDSKFINLRLKRFIGMTNDMINESLSDQIGSYNNYIKNLPK